MPLLTANGTQLYHEVRGAGPPVLLVMGATGDGGHFETLADLLADEFAVVTYDRRGNGRSPRRSSDTPAAQPHRRRATAAAGVVPEIRKTGC